MEVISKQVLDIKSHDLAIEGESHHFKKKVLWLLIVGGVAFICSVELSAMSMLHLPSIKCSKLLQGACTITYYENTYNVYSKENFI